MATYKSIPISSIHIGERARPVDEDHALAIAASMAERGLINPITVRATPAANKGKTPFTLVAGGHRLRGAVINQWTEIDTIVVEADAIEAQLIELSENIFRNELSKLERPLFVMKFREIFEEKHGKINSNGGRPKKQGNDCPVFTALGKELSQQVQERLGIGERTYKYVTQIGQNLSPELRNVLRGTTAENDQSMLLKLAKLPRDDQFKIAAAIKHEPDVKKVLAFTKPPAIAVAPSQAAILSKLIAAWDDASEETREQFLQHIGMGESDSLMAQIREEAA